jgi:hypothetical protein
VGASGLSAVGSTPMAVAIKLLVSASSFVAEGLPDCSVLTVSPAPWTSGSPIARLVSEATSVALMASKLTSSDRVRLLSSLMF